MKKDGMMKYITNIVSFDEVDAQIKSEVEK
jgi:hypothetical protein